jgi:FixJ family two-component response regulator
MNEVVRLQKTHRVSIVDDDQSVREATRCLLRSLGYAATTYASAEEFLAGPGSAQSDCLITDVHMPGLSGVELQQRLRALGINLPVIFITAYPNARTRAQVLEAGALAYLSKPYSEDKLIDCLETAMRSSDAS